MASRFFFVPNAQERDWHVPHDVREEIHHEVMYEDEATSIRERPLYLGTPFTHRRFLMLLLCVGSVLLALLGRAFWMQEVQGSLYAQLAESNRLRQEPLWPKRGIIRDRSGIILADNIPRFQVTMTPRDLAKGEQLSLDLGQAARLLGTSINDLRVFADATGTVRDEAVLVVDGLSYERAMSLAVALPHLAGFHLEIRPKRRYPLSPSIPSLAHVLGYVGKVSEQEYSLRREEGYRRADEIGKIGVEATYERELRGQVGERVSEVDAFGRRRAGIREEPSVDGKEMRLTLDSQLQRAAEQALQAQLTRAKTTRGAVVAIDPRDGAILALVSWPGYDNNLFSGTVSSTAYRQLANDPSHPLFPRAWSGTYPSGSTVKIVISVAALAEKIITPLTSVMSAGGIRVGPWFFPDWKPGGHGVTNVRKAIAWSVNTFYYYIGGGYESFVGLGSDRLAGWMRRFGLGQKTGIDLPAEAAGFVPSKEWKQETKGEPWFLGDTYNLSIGQGDLLVTPLQVAQYAAAVANGGTLLHPHVLESMKDVRGGERSGPTFAPRSTQLADPGVFETVRLGMRDAVTYGSARALSVLPFPVAGKTGTAQWSSNKQTHAWFTGFAPFESPEMVVAVLLEEGGEGSSYAVPVAKDVFQAWWRLRTERGGAF
jgi:penicillin-binding protein 2